MLSSLETEADGIRQSYVFFKIPVLKTHLDGLHMVTSFCGSILADCFVLTPHNNQLRHCQRNTHSSHFSWHASSSTLPLLGFLCSFTFPRARPLRTHFRYTRPTSWKPLCQQAGVFLWAVSRMSKYLLWQLMTDKCKNFTIRCNSLESKFSFWPRMMILCRKKKKKVMKVLFHFSFLGTRCSWHM